jgi:drug/metabolite transporter (DMT)-like permease
MGYFIFDEGLSVWKLIGGALILCAIYIASVGETGAESKE